MAGFESDLWSIRVSCALARSNDPMLGDLHRGSLSHERLVFLLVQWWFHERGRNRALRNLLKRCRAIDMRAEIAEALYEADTGRISGGAPHDVLYDRVLRALGVDPDRVAREGRLVAEMAAVINCYHYACAVLDPVVGYAVMAFADAQGEGSNGLPGPIPGPAEALVAHYGCSWKDVACFSPGAPLPHGGLHLDHVAGHAGTPERRDDVLAAVAIAADALADLGRLAQYDPAACWSRNGSALLYL